LASKTSMAKDWNEQRLPNVRIRWQSILLLATAARLILALVLFEFHAVPPLNNWGYENIAIAQSLHEGHGFSSPYFSPSGPTAFMAPGYPLFLAAIMALFGTGTVAATVIVILQEIFSLLTVVMVMIAARNWFGARTANLAGFISAVAPPMLMAPVWIWDTSFSALAIAAAFAAASGPALTRKGFITAGAGWAIVGLVNPSLIPSLWAMCGWSAWKARKFPWLGILVFLVVFASWPVRNAIVMHTFIPLRTDFGYELWMGNHPGGSGNPEESLNPMTSKAEREAFLRMGELRYLDGKGAQAKAYIRSAPARFLELSAKRFARFWTGSEPGVNFVTITFCLLGFGGLFFLWRERRDLAVLYALPLLVFPLPYYFTLVIARFQYVIAPVLALLAAHMVAVMLGDDDVKRARRDDDPSAPFLASENQAPAKG